MNYFTSDTHLGHKVIIKYRPQFKTQEEHDEAILSQIEKLTKRDILYVIGDFIFDSEKFEYYLERISKCPCRIKLVMGNHDSLKLYSQNIAKNIEIQLPLFSYKNMWITHCPIIPQEIRGRSGVIHGHLHGGVVKKYSYNPLSDYDELIKDERYFNVNLDNNNFKFVELETIKQYFNI